MNEKGKREVQVVKTDMINKEVTEKFGLRVEWPRKIPITNPIS